MGGWYCTREQVKRSPDVKTTAYADATIDRLIESSSRSIDALCHRVFHPFVGTRYFDWPSDRYGATYRIYVENNDIISLESLVSGGVTIPPADYFLEPANEGPPYTRIEIDLSSSSSFVGGTTRQRSIAATGVFGNRGPEELLGTLTEQMPTGSAADIDTSYLMNPEVGMIFRIEDEFFEIAGLQTFDSGQNLGTSMTASAANNIVAVADSATFARNASIVLDAEKMLILDIAGNNLIVKRAWDGSVLAAHNSGIDVYYERNVQLVRERFGSTEAVHAISSELQLWKIPPLVNQLAIAETLNAFQQEDAGYARVVSAGDSARELVVKGLQDLRDRVYTAHGRKVRMRAV